MAVTDRPARLVMVDRDGVINEDSAEYIKSVANGGRSPAASKRSPR